MAARNDVLIPIEATYEELGVCVIPPPNYCTRFRSGLSDSHARSTRRTGFGDRKPLPTAAVGTTGWLRLHGGSALFPVPSG